MMIACCNKSFWQCVKLFENIRTNMVRSASYSANTTYYFSLNIWVNEASQGTPIRSACPTRRQAELIMVYCIDRGCVMRVGQSSD